MYSFRLYVRLVLHDPLRLLCTAKSLGWILPKLFGTDDHRQERVCHTQWLLMCISSRSFSHDFARKLFNYGTCFVSTLQRTQFWIDSFPIWGKWSLTWGVVLCVTTLTLAHAFTVIRPWTGNRNCENLHYVSCVNMSSSVRIFLWGHHVPTKNNMRGCVELNDFLTLAEIL